MRPLLDSDLLLDVAQNREPHVVASRAVLDWAEKEPRRALIAWHSIANLYYMLERPSGRANAREFVRELVQWAGVLPRSSVVPMACPVFIPPPASTTVKHLP